MKSFTSYLLIGIILTFVSFVVFGFFSDDKMVLKSNIRIQNSTTQNIQSVLGDINETKQWSLLFKQEDIEFELDESEKEIEWRRKGKESWMKLKTIEEDNSVLFKIMAKGQEDTFMKFTPSQDQNDVEVECKYEIEIPLLFRFFKKSMKEKLSEDLDKNLIALKSHIEA